MGLPAAPKNTPETTALTPASFVTRNFTWPVMFHDRYFPPLKLDTVCELRTALVVASSTSICSDRCVLSQSRQ